jgi:hypothetical protein
VVNDHTAALVEVMPRAARNPRVVMRMGDPAKSKTGTKVGR